MTAVVPETLALAAQLRTATSIEHEEAENMGFITQLMGGELPLAALADFHAQHQLIYRALESGGDNLATDPIAQPFLFPQLRRLPALEADLTFLIGADWPEKVEVTKAAAAYAERITSAATWAGGYIAHAYVRYLGDLSGGQAIGRLMQRAYGLKSDGIRFYEFPDVKPKPFKDNYRALLDAAPFSAAEREQIVSEAKVAFQMNTKMFAELGERHYEAD